ncbi:MAG: VCBS repeat-containing protein [Phycisphaerae bacterium]|nr:VCBS repeat-containing protein [Phycisphaerae bacterium]
MVLTARTAASGLLSMLCAASAGAQNSSADLARYFGWDEPRIVVGDKGVGPALVADMNGDGLNDLVIANNAKSRLEIHVQRRTPRTEQEITREYKVNDLPPSPYYDRVEVSVAHRVSSFRVRDIDSDGRPDILYAGDRSEIVILRQVESLKFDVLSKRRVKDLQAGQDGIEIADVMGDEQPELLVVVGGRIAVFGLSSSAVTGEPVLLGAGGANEQIVAFFVEDLNGDGLNDVMAAIPDDAAPVRLWLQERSAGAAGKGGQLGPELRFEMPPLRELDTVRFDGRAAASIAYIERPTRRIVLADLKAESDSSAVVGGGRGARAGERDASFASFAFSGAANKSRSLAVVDLDADGLLDLLATDQQANTLVLYRQQRGIGLTNAKRFSALKDPKSIAAGQWDDDPALEVFVLSEADKVVGVSDYDAESDRLSFPQPLTMATPGASPVAMAYATLKSGPALAVIAKDKRDHTLELHRPGADGQPMTVKLEGVSRPPQSMLAGDFDHDGNTDLLLFTPGEPLVMVASLDGPSDGIKVLTDKLMPQFGLVQAAGPDNTAQLDIDRDGFDELLLADQNFVRACEFKEGAGWRVVEQITLPEASASLTGLTVLRDGEAGGAVIIAADKANKRLVLMSKSDEGGWAVTDRLRFPAFDASSLFAGAFSGDGRPGILAVSDSAFALVSLSGRRYTLDEVSAFRNDDDDRLEHEIEVGDLNSDGMLDMVCLDAREQMCQVFAFTQARRILLATEFEVFESRLFGRGDDRDFEPSAAIIADLTGDGRNDLILQVHDRYMIYPQMGPTK